MAAVLKCPSSSCPFLFDPTQVPPGAVLTCPRCATRFVLGTAPATQIAEAPAFGSAAPAMPDVPVDRPARAAGGNPWLVALAVAAVLATALAVGVVLIGGAPGGGGHRGPQRYEDFNASFDFPGPPWVGDPAPPPAARANLFALKHADSDARAAFGASDFKTRMPQPGELKEMLLDRLGGLFDDLDPMEDKAATWLDRSAVKFTFRGVDKGTATATAGEAVAVGVQGVGYWMLAFAPEKEVAAHVAAFEDLRGRLKVLDLRPEWKETTTAFVAFAGEAAEYRVIDTERWWAKPAGLNPMDADAKADMLLRAEYRTKKKIDFKPRAELVGFVLEPVGDAPLAAIRRLLKERYDARTALFGATKLTDVTGDPLGDPPVGAEQPTAETVRIHAAPANAPDAGTLHVLAAVAVGDKVAAVDASCAWADRAAWERRLVHLAGSLRAGR